MYQQYFGYNGYNIGQDVGAIRILQNDTSFHICIFSCRKPHFEVVTRTHMRLKSGLGELKKSKVKSRMELHSFLYFHLVLN